MEIGHAEWMAHTREDTARLAQLLAAMTGPGTVIALDGDLGAGKTFFSQAYAAALGITETVNSPTFTIIKEYESGRLPLYHMDVYRLSVDEADELGLDDYFYGAGASVVEWASLIRELLPPERLELYIELAGDQARRIRVAGRGGRYAEWCRQLAGTGEAEA